MSAIDPLNIQLMGYKFHSCLKKKSSEMNLTSWQTWKPGVEHSLIFRRPHWLSHNLKMTHTVSPFSFTSFSVNDLFFLPHLCLPFSQSFMPSQDVVIQPKVPTPGIFLLLKIGISGFTTTRSRGICGVHGSSHRKFKATAVDTQTYTGSGHPLEYPLNEASLTMTVPRSKGILSKWSVLWSSTPRIYTNPGEPPHTQLAMHHADACQTLAL